MTINDDYRDAGIRHSIWLERYKTGLDRRVLAILDRAESDLVKQISERLAKIQERGFDLGVATTNRLEALLESVREKQKEIYSEAHRTTRDELKDFAEYEAGFQARMVEAAIAPVSTITVSLPPRSVLNAAVTSKPFQGRLLREWFSGLATDAAQKVNNAIVNGVVQGQTTDQIVRVIRGTAARSFEDGVLAISRRNATSVVRTATAHVAARAKDDMFNANSKIVVREIWVSVLDGRTTLGCAVLDGKIFKRGEGPQPPRHFNCRSMRLAFFDGSSVKGVRASAFGPVPETTNYETWLRGQSVALQNEVLGEKKGQLFRKGKLPLDRFVDKNLESYTLDELRYRDAAAWDKTFNDG